MSLPRCVGKPGLQCGVIIIYKEWHRMLCGGITTYKATVRVQCVYCFYKERERVACGVVISFLKRGLKCNVVKLSFVKEGLDFYVLDWSFVKQR